jgi:hypothetical protein
VTAYFLLRPCFEPVKPFGPLSDKKSREYLQPQNWKLKSGDEASTALHGASLGHGQELTDALHSHLDLA